MDKLTILETSRTSVWGLRVEDLLGQVHNMVKMAKIVASGPG